MARSGSFLVSITSKDQEFHESDYHTPRRKKAILERNSTACLCVIFFIVLITLILVCVTVGVRLTGSHNHERYTVTEGDSQLIVVDSYFCQSVELELIDANDAVASMSVLNDKPPLGATSNITVHYNFLIPKFIEYTDDYGWYDYYYYESEEIVEYVTLSYQLYSGSFIELTACVFSEEDGNEADFILVRGKSQYGKWKRSSNGYYEHKSSIPACSTPNPPHFTYSVSDSDRYYLIFQAINGEPFVNITLQLNRTEYIANSQPTCNSTDESSCVLPLSLSHQPYYILLETIVSDLSQYGKKLKLEWRCHARQWIYIVIFFVPIIFVSLLCTSMYCVFAYFNKRKIRSYQTLDNRDVASSTKQAKLYYGENPLTI